MFGDDADAMVRKRVSDGVHILNSNLKGTFGAEHVPGPEPGMTTEHEPASEQKS